MSKLEIWHNPRCSKSRQTLALIREQAIEPEIRLYLESPPTPEQIDRVLQKLNMAPLDLMRKKEAEFKELGLDESNLEDHQYLKILSTHPRLIERPIVITKSQAVIGRPPENVLQLLK